MAAIGLACSILGGAATWLLSAWNARRAAVIADRKDTREAADDAIEALRETMGELREEVTRLSKRVKAAEAAEELCRGKLRQVRDAVHAMAGALQQHGILASDIPGWPIPPGE
jgi:chromosome segregation ATPase